MKKVYIENCRVREFLENVSDYRELVNRCKADNYTEV